MLNRVVLIGRLTRDPELRYTQSGQAVVNFRIAVSRPFTNQQGEREADFINIVAWRKTAETCAAHLNKGRLVAVDGRIQTGSYDGPDGQKRYTTDVVAEDVRFLDWGNGSQSQEGQGSGSQYGTPDDNEDVPF